MAFALVAREEHKGNELQMLSTGTGFVQPSSSAMGTGTGPPNTQRGEQMDIPHEAAEKLEEILLRRAGESSCVIKAELRETYPDLTNDDYLRVLGYTLRRSGNDLAGSRPR